MKLNDRYYLEALASPKTTWSRTTQVSPHSNPKSNSNLS